MARVGKYDALIAWEREDGLRWSVHLGEWVTEESNQFTSWLDTLDSAEWASAGTLPPGGQPVNINEP
jgi:hypothetical protein